MANLKLKPSIFTPTLLSILIRHIEILSQYRDILQLPSSNQRTALHSWVDIRKVLCLYLFSGLQIKVNVIPYENGASEDVKKSVETFVGDEFGLEQFSNNKSLCSRLLNLYSSYGGTLDNIDVERNRHTVNFRYQEDLDQIKSSYKTGTLGPKLWKAYGLKTLRKRAPCTLKVLVNIVEENTMSSQMRNKGK